ncbi:MAG: hypothetical protein KJ077_08290 [Anaerolineae bacterium]|nr:hypothetical protein [Anaerolineae bacterium]
MATNTIVPRSITLSNGQVLAVPEGADASAFKRFEEAKLRRASNPKKKTPKKSPSRSGSSRRRTLRTSVPFAPSSAERQTQRTGRAAGELVERANGKPEEDGEVSAILINAAGRFFGILEVASV